VLALLRESVREFGQTVVMAGGGGTTPADALGFSVNNYLVRAAAAALENERRPRQARTTVTGQSLSGWAG
jgi:hypothetical protein